MKRKLSFVLALLMVAALFSACGTAETGGSASISENSGVTSQTAETNPYEKGTELIWYCSGNTSEDTSKVMDAFNSQLKEKCNTTIQLNYVGFNDWDNQLNLILTSWETWSMSARDLITAMPKMELFWTSPRCSRNICPKPMPIFLRQSFLLLRPTGKYTGFQPAAMAIFPMASCTERI